MWLKKGIYVASPLGFSEIGRNFMYSKIIPIMEDMGYPVIDPWKLTSEELIDPVIKMPPGPEKVAAWKNLNKVIGENNVIGIKKSKGIFAILDGVDVDSGTSSEIGYGAALKKPILGYRGDFRQAGDNEGSIVNLQVEYFIKQNGGQILTAINDLECALIETFGDPN